MCEHDWESISRTADGTGNVYEYSICTICGDSKEDVIDDLSR